MKKTPEASDIQLHIMKLQTEQLDHVMDDEYFHIVSSIPNGDYHTANQFELKLAETSTNPEALAFGGVAVWSNLKPETLRKALVLGLDIALRSQQLDINDFIVGGEDGAE